MNQVCLNESPSEKEGKSHESVELTVPTRGLNESPSEKEGKCLVDSVSEMQTVTASMKVPPKRKGNIGHTSCIR